MNEMNLHDKDIKWNIPPLPIPLYEYGILSQERVKYLLERFLIHCCRAVEVSMDFDLGGVVVLILN